MTNARAERPHEMSKGVSCGSRPRRTFGAGTTPRRLALRFVVCAQMGEQECQIQSLGGGGSQVAGLHTGRNGLAKVASGRDELAAHQPEPPTQPAEIVGYPYALALHAAGRVHEGFAVMAGLRKHVLTFASTFADPSERERFLALSPRAAQIVERAEEWLGPAPS